MQQRIVFTILSLGILTLIWSTGCGSQHSADKMSQTDLVKRGEYLVEFGGCHDCHTPKLFTPQGPQPNMALAFSGHPSDFELADYDPILVGPGKWILFNDHLTAAVGPWGTSFSANLTADEQTGIGLWTEEIFSKAMRTGLHMGNGRPILPPMPWFNVAKLNDQDMGAVYAFLKSNKAIKNLVPGALPPKQ